MLKLSREHVIVFLTIVCFLTQSVSVESSIMHNKYGGQRQISSEAINDNISPAFDKSNGDLNLTSSTFSYGKYAASLDTMGGSSDNSTDTKTSKNNLLHPSTFKASNSDGVVRAYSNPPQVPSEDPQLLSNGGVRSINMESSRHGAESGPQTDESAFVRKIKKASVTLKSLHHLYRDYLQKEREESYKRRQRQPRDAADVANFPPPENDADDGSRQVKSSKSKQRHGPERHRHHKHDRHHKSRDRSGSRNNGVREVRHHKRRGENHVISGSRERGMTREHREHSRSIPTLGACPEIIFSQPYSQSEYTFIPTHGALHL